jgi:hypothetical protein
MKKNIVFSLFLVISLSFFSGFVFSRNAPQVSIKMNIKDLPQYNLRLIGPSDPSFDERMKKEFRGESNEVIDALKPFSVFLENKGKSTVVGYLIQWGFTKADGTNQYYRKAVLNRQALMGGGEDLAPELSRQSGQVEPHSAIFLSLLSPEGGGNLGIEISREEAEQIKQGKRPDQSTVLQRFRAEAAQCSAITVTIDAAVFDDGTFVGPDTSNFFNQTKAVIEAKRDFLNELSAGLSGSGEVSDSLHGRLQETASEQVENLGSKSTPDDYYNYFKKLSAIEFLQATKAQGEKKAIERAQRELNKNKPWATLRKKDQ